MVEYTVRCGCSLPEGRGELGRGPPIRAVLGCCEGHESTNITPLSKRTLGPTAERLCYCGSHAAGSEQIENAAHMAGLSQNPIPDLVVQPILGSGSMLTLWLFFLPFFWALSGI